MTEPIRYRIVPEQPEAHLYRVSCTVAEPDSSGQEFALPAWIPGSYMIREFARHIVSIRAESRGRPVAVDKLDKHSWRVRPVDGPVTVVCEVYAGDLSVRGAYLDTQQAFFNGASVFLRPRGHESAACELEILRPRGARYRGWIVATAMTRNGAKLHGFGAYRASDYDELIDHPVAMGGLTLASFRACGVPHDVAITGRHRADVARLARDLKRLCEWHIRFWNESPTSRLSGVAAPMKRYLFLISALGEGYGGLEHRASTALLCSRDDLPRRGEALGERYRTFLGLASHEYFHTWNVKRIKPAAFTPYDLDRESYTSLLWAFEGMTSYYDDLALVRSGLIGRKDYLELLGRAITAHLRAPGRRRQTLAAASFDAWIKYYRPDENSPNATVSYYGKGSLVALCLDLLIRDRTRGRKSLDDVMRALWRRHGMTGVGVEEDGIERLAEEVTGLKLGRVFDDWLRSTRELPLRALLAKHGVDMVLRPAESSSDKGGRAAGSKTAAGLAMLGAAARASGEDTVLTHVLDGGAAQEAGLAAGDAIVAVDGLRPGRAGLDSVLAKRRPGERVAIHAFRRDELLEVEARLKPAPADTCVLCELPGAKARALGRWLED
ncbi:MAG TPA: PDZ domain-containing protein [Burkholderiales bacterium]|nr:PDZ domain-containing protein [Burkholderiales bacterium]